MKKVFLSKKLFIALDVIVISVTVVLRYFFPKIFSGFFIIFVLIYYIYLGICYYFREKCYFAFLKKFFPIEYEIQVEDDDVLLNTTFSNEKVEKRIYYVLDNKDKFDELLINEMLDYLEIVDMCRLHSNLGIIIVCLVCIFWLL